MTLPFTVERFFGVLDAYNEALWPAALALWLVTALVCASSLRGSAGFVPALLVTHWIWAGLAYHAFFFTRINPAAWLFSGLFVLEAAVLGWFGLVKGRIRYAEPASSFRHIASRILLAYALLYPVIAQAEGHAYPRLPTFGVPCPTTILTTGFLLAADSSLPRVVTVIPILWAFVGGSAALLFGVRADLMLFVSGLVLIGDVATRQTTVGPAPRAAHRSA